MEKVSLSDIENERGNHTTQRRWRRRVLGAATI